MNDFEKLATAKNMLINGKSEFIVAEDLDLSLVIVNDLRNQLTKNIKSQAIDNRIALRQSIRNKIPQAIDKAVEIMNMKFDKLILSGANDKSEGTVTGHVSFIKVQLDAAKAILGLASQAIGEDFLSLYTEKPDIKRENFKVEYRNEILPNGAIRMKTSTVNIPETESIKIEEKEMNFN